MPEPQFEQSTAGPVHDECQQDDDQNDDHHPEEKHDDAGNGIPRYSSRSSHGRQLPTTAQLIRAETQRKSGLSQDRLSRAAAGDVRRGTSFRSGDLALPEPSAVPRTARPLIFRSVASTTLPSIPCGFPRLGASHREGER